MRWSTGTRGIGPSRHHQTSFLQPLPGGTRRRPLDMRIGIAQAINDLLGSPIGMFVFLGQQRGNDFVGRLMRTVQRLARLLFQAIYA
ncbi:hypothetical protein D3C81_1110780 [compost metagenome]